MTVFRKNRRFLKAAVFVLLLTLCVLPLAACGNGGGSSSEAAQSDALSQQDSTEPSSQEETAQPEEEEPEEDEEEGQLLQFMDPDPSVPMAVMNTSMGEIRILLYPEHAPLAVDNFITHAQNGYYDGVIFHRVMEDFMIQTGDPTGTGFGGESIYSDDDGNPVYFEDQFSPYLAHFRGALSMANGGPNTNSSQFFIVQSPQVPGDAAYYRSEGYPDLYINKYLEVGGTPHLDGKHTIFGMVLEGMDVVDAIAAVPTTDDMPDTPVIIESITIENA